MKTIVSILTFCAIYHVSSASLHRRLQQTPTITIIRPSYPSDINTLPIISYPINTRPATISYPIQYPIKPINIIGPSGLDCTPGTDDNPPDNCIPPGGQIFTDFQIECKENFDCCLCKSMICGSMKVPCKILSCNGDSSCLGVQDINVVGNGDAEINCNGDFSCNTVWIKGKGIKQVICNGDHSCANSRFDLVCNPHAPCAIQCSGDNSCQGLPRPKCQYTRPPTCSIFTIRNTAGLSCSDDACSNGVFHFDNNFGGNILCNGETSCVNAEIVINDVALLICGQAMACKNADITIIDPRQDFSLECTAPGSCEGMILTLIINNQDITLLKAFRCGDEAACRGLIVQVTRSTHLNVFIEKLECTALNACQNAEFILGDGISFQTCECGASEDRACDGIRGIDSCLTGLEKLECSTSNICYDTREVIQNPAQNFELICGNVRSCESFYLTLNIDNSASSPVTLFRGYTCSDIQSCKDAIITINNQQSNTQIKIDSIKCTGDEACMNTRFISNGNIGINYFICLNHDSCQGCTHTYNGVCQNCNGYGDSYCPS